jgi:hypothetical protein
VSAGEEPFSDWYSYPRWSVGVAFLFTIIGVAVVVSSFVFLEFTDFLLLGGLYLPWIAFGLYGCQKSLMRFQVSPEGIRVRGIWRDAFISRARLVQVVRREAAKQEWVRLDHQMGRVRVFHSLNDYSDFVAALSALVPVSWHGEKPLTLPLEVKSRSAYEGLVIGIILAALGIKVFQQETLYSVGSLLGILLMLGGPIIITFWTIRFLSGGKTFTFTHTDLTVPTRFRRKTYPAEDLHAIVLHESLPQSGEVQRVLVLGMADGRGYTLESRDVRMPLVPLARFLYHMYKERLVLQQVVDDPGYVPYAETIRPRTTQ